MTIVALKKPGASSKSSNKISNNCKLITLLLCNILIVLIILFPIYQRLLQTSAHTNHHHHQYTLLQPPATTLNRHQQQDGEIMLPYISKDLFNQKYASKYKGRLPRTKRIETDPACGNRPDFFKFFLLPKSER